MAQHRGDSGIASEECSDCPHPIRATAQFATRGQWTSWDCHLLPDKNGPFPAIYKQQEKRSCCYSTTLPLHSDCCATFTSSELAWITTLRLRVITSTCSEPQHGQCWRAYDGILQKGTEVGTVTLWGFYMSSCTWRVRLALGLKGIPYEYKALDISNGEHKSEEFKKISPLQYVPALEVDGVAIADSMAIIMYFEEKFPDKRLLLPVDLVERATVRQVVYLIGASIQPLQNLGCLKMVEARLGADERLKWAQDHINIGFTALEQLLKKIAGKYTVGDELTLTSYPTIDRIGKALLELPEVQASLPANERDAPK